MQNYSVYCLRPGDACLYAIGVATTQFIGRINMGRLGDENLRNEQDLRGGLGRMGISTADQDRIINECSSAGAMFILSGVSIPDNVVENYGIELHDGDRSEEPNKIVFSRCDDSNGELIVRVIMNDQLMPVPVDSCLRWSEVKKCLSSSGQLTETNIKLIEKQIQMDGTGELAWQGISTGILDCLGKR